MVRDSGVSNTAYNPTGDVVIHTLRHTAISRMMDANIDPRTIMDISGHSSLAELDRYTSDRVAQGRGPARAGTVRSGSPR